MTSQTQRLEVRHDPPPLIRATSDGTTLSVTTPLQDSIQSKIASSSCWRVFQHCWSKSSSRRMAKKLSTPLVS
jgi:hypothetical protein